MKKRLWVVLTIAEPFPVFFSHVDCQSELRPETARGPFYSANSKSYSPPEHRSFVEWQAEQLRAKGWTVTVGEELR